VELAPLALGFVPENPRFVPPRDVTVPGPLNLGWFSGSSVSVPARGAGILTLAVLALLHAGAAAGIDPAIPPSQYGHDAWTSDSGLPQNSVFAIAQTSDGYLWLGTQEGLVRFDGVRFTIFDTRNTPELPDDWVQALAAARDGSLWIGTVSGLVHMHDRKFETLAEGGIDRAQVGALYEDSRGAIWAGSNLGATRIAGKSVRTFTDCDGLSGPVVRSIGEDSSGALWVGGQWGAARLEAERFVPWTVSDGFPGAALAIVPDPEGGMWVGTGRGLAHVDGLATTLYGEGTALMNTLVRALRRDADGNLWLATDGGIFRFREGRFVRHGASDGLSSDRILSLAEDREGSLWVGTSDGGLDRVQARRMTMFAEREGLSEDKLWAVLEDRRGNLWAGTADGVLSRRPPGKDRFERFAVLGAAVLAIAEGADGALWIGTRGAGLVRLEGKNEKRYTMKDGLSGNAIASVLVDQKGVVWAGTMAAGLNRFEGGRFVTYRARDGLASDAIFSLFEDRAGAVWISTFGGGVSRFADGKFRTFTTRDGLAHDVVTSTYQDGDGTYWFSTRGGLSRYRDGRFTTFRQKEGVFHDAPQKVFEDGRGYLWLTSNRGVFRISQAELAAAAKSPGRINDRVTFSTATRMVPVECNGTEHGAWRDRDGRLWFATVKGLAMVDPDRIQLNPVPPTVVIEQVVSGGARLDAPDRIALPPGSDKLEFGYTALSFRSPQAVRFRYRLEGFERDWVDAGTRRRAFYTNLPPGHYRFHVLAANEDGVWSRAGASLDIGLARHFYQTAWFRAAALLCAAFAVVFGYRLRVRRLEARERLRTALVEAQLDALQFQLRPHFLFNTLNSIMPLIGKDPERARQMVVRLGDLLRLSLRSEDTPLVTLEQEIAILEKYLSIEKVRFRDRLDVEIAIEPGVAAANVPSFLLQPLVENAIKHGLAGRAGRGCISIVAGADRGQLAIRLRDNGPGPRHDYDESSGIGLRNTRRRLEALYPGAHLLELAPAPEGGCDVRLRIPLTLAHLALRRSAPDAPARIPQAS